MSKFTLLFLPILLFAPSSLPCEEFFGEDYFSSFRYYPDLDVEELELSNGMRAVLKKMNTSDPRLYIRVSALGGYAQLDEKNLEYGKIAGKLIKKNGIGALSADQFYSDLYQQGIEYSAKILSYSRFIEIRCHPSSLHLALSIVHKAFTEGISKKFSESFFRQHLTALGKGKEKILSILSNTFKNPSDFTTIIVGNYPPTTQKLLREHLETIPAGKGHWLDTFTPQTKQSHLRERGVAVSNTHRLAMTTITFPVSTPISPSNLPQLQVLLKGLKSLFLKDIKHPLEKHQINLYISFPCYPCREESRVNLELFSTPEKVPELVQEIFTLLHRYAHMDLNTFFFEKNWSKAPPLEKIKSYESDYWLSQLTTYSLWRWKLDGSPIEVKNPPEHFCHTPQCMIRCIFQNNLFHIQTTYPKKYLKE